MNTSFRQSMAFLHTWGGLLVGWVLFFVFLTGTFGYVNQEVDRWMKPEQPMASSAPAPAVLLPMAEKRLNEEAADAQSWFIYFPEGGRDNEFAVGWRVWPEGEARFGEFNYQVIDPATGVPAEHSVRETGGGGVLYAMHYQLHYLPYDVAVLIVGVCSMFMLVAIISGVIVHKKIFKDFFTFRPGKGQRSWLDGHNLLSVSALPFHLMITWSGLIFYMFTYMPASIEAFYPKGEMRDKFYTEVSGTSRLSPGRPAPTARFAPLSPMLAEAETQWGADHATFIRIESPGREGAQVLIYADQSGVSRSSRTLLFDGVTGALIDSGPKAGAALGRFEQVMLGLHEGRFAGPVLRALYVLAGLAGTAMIATGLLLWSAKRKAKLAEYKTAHFGIAAVDILNLGTIIGLPVGIAAYFWANRLLPVGMEGRADWEVHVMFLTWSLTFIYAIWRPLDRARLELCALAAAAYGFIPVLNALTTGRGLAASISQSDWVFVGFDLSAFCAGLFFIFLIRMIYRKQKKHVTARPEISSASSQVEAA